MSALYTPPFTVLIDAQEKTPFSFAGLSRGIGPAALPIVVKTEYRSLGAGLGDYSIDGFQPTPGTKYSLPGLRGCISIERKSLGDCHSTILGWGEHRDRFEVELANLAQMKFAAVVVECSLGRLLDEAPQWGVRTVDENRRSLESSIQSWQQRWPSVHWIFCDGRQQAEEWAYRHLERFWEYEMGRCKRSKRQRNREQKHVGKQLKGLF